MVKKAVIHTNFVAPYSRLKRNKNRWKRGLIIFASVVQNKISGPGERYYVDLTQIFVKKGYNLYKIRGQCLPEE